MAFAIRTTVRDKRRDKRPQGGTAFDDLRGMGFQPMQPETTPRPNTDRAGQDGAALVVAIGVMTVLLAISLTFFNMTTQEQDSATNVANRVKAELLVDGAFATGIAFLNHDLLAHPTYTSTDHAWRTYFNGAWAAGKPWMWDTAVTGLQPNAESTQGPPPFFNSPNPITNPDKAIPLIDLLQIRGASAENPDPDLDFNPDGTINVDGDGNLANDEFMFTGPLTRDWLYIPRVDVTTPFTSTAPFKLLAPPLRPERQFAANLAGKFPPPGEDLLPEEYPYTIQNDPLISDINLFNLDLNQYNWFQSDRDFPLQFREAGRETGHVAATLLGDPLAPVTSGILTPAQQVDMWADVDNDGDGLRDSNWIPIGADRLFPFDGLDNDLDGLLDAYGRDGDQDTPQDNDTDGEPGLFLYRANTNGIDDDCDGETDDGDPDNPASEYHIIYTTMPLDQMFRYRLFPSLPFTQPIPLSDVREILSLAGADPSAVRDETERPCVGGSWSVDNDYTLLVNDGVDGRGYVINFVNNQLNPYAEIASRNISEFFPPSDGTPQGDLDRIAAVLQIYGEPVTELVGRMAILINDEASKVNVSAAGGLRYQEIDNDTAIGDDDIAIAQSSGAGPWEYDTRVLPQLGDALSSHTWQLMMGATEGVGLPLTDQIQDADAAAEYWFDVSFPGYGRVDDDGNALWLSMNGVDDDGDGFVDEGINPRYPELFGLFEGIDEPSEFRAFQPYRNSVAEGKTIVQIADEADNDGDGVVNEIGEYGDRNLRTDEQLKLVDQIGVARYDAMRNLVTVHSTDKNERHRFRDLDLSRNVSGLKLNYALAPIGDIADAFVNDRLVQFDGKVFPEKEIDASQPTGYRDFAPGDPDLPEDEAQAFGAGLRVAGLTWRLNRFNGMNGLLGGASYFTPGGPILIEEDPELAASLLAVNTKDSLDTNYARSELTVSVRDEWFEGIQPPGSFLQRDIEYTVAGVESIRINEIMVRPVRRIEAEMNIAEPPEPQFDPSPFAALPQFIASVSRLGDLPTFGGGSGWTRFGEHLGDRAFWGTNFSRLNDDPDPLVPYDVVQFRFRPSSGLPPGRYYLKLNVTLNGLGNTSSVIQDGQLLYAVKYVSRIGVAAADGHSFDSQDILADVDEFSLGDADRDLDLLTYWQPVTSALNLVGFDDAPAPNRTGLVFLATQADSVEDPFTLISSGFPNPGIPGYLQGDAYTITIPPDDAAAPYDLCVALRLNPNLVAGLSTDGVDNDSDGTIDEAGEVDLAINFFEFSQEPDHEWVEIVNVAKSGDPVNISGWTLEVANRIPSVNTASPLTMKVPTQTFIGAGDSLLLAVNKFDRFAGFIPAGEDATNADLVINNGIGLARSEAVVGLENVTVPPIGAPPDATDTGSVFDRGAKTDDFADTDGNGIDPDDGTDPADTYSSTGGGNDAAWDRIIQLSNVPTTAGLTDLAQLILDGGVFPNRPEFDGIDNDGDAAVLQADDLDNDGDGAFDEDGEGVDEGQVRLDLFHQIGFDINVPGAYQRVATSFTPLDFEFAAVPYVFYYTGLPADPPDWKEFVERRMFPGDNVIITLYEGDAGNGRIVDRVTYTQRDVENRAIDDIVDNVYTEGGAGVSLEGPDGRASMWPENSMAFDFYRSLERKHPLYTGDKFGTQNRWQATDGNYDDWAPSTSVFEARVGTLGELSFINADRADNPRYRHAFSGSPLRMNLSQRLIENPNSQWPGALSEQNRWRFELADVNGDAFKSPADALFVPRVIMLKDLLANTGGGIEEINASQSPIRSVVTGAVPYNLAGSDWQSGLLQVTAGERDPDESRVAVDSATLDTLVLSAGQAEFLALPQFGGPSIENLTTWDGPLPAAWVPVLLFELPGDVFKYRLTNGYSLDLSPVSQGGVLQQLFNFFGVSPAGLFLGQPKFARGIAPDALAARWPTERRIAFYAAANRSDAPLPAAAYFRWDGSDGLENGEYDVYVGTIESLDPLRSAAISDPATTMLSRWANELVGTDGEFVDLFNVVPLHRLEDRSDFAVDLEFYTQRDGDELAAVEFPSGNADQDDSFGEQIGLVPDEQGIVRYGTVRVEGNVLVMRLANQGDPGAVNRFSRVILAPRQKTRGRININTVETRPVPSGAYPDIPNDLVDPLLFNALSGLPGVLIWFDFEDGLSDFPAATSQPVSSAMAGRIASPSITRTNDQGEPGIIVNQDIFYRAREIVLGRTDHYDGRYYEYMADLAARDPATLQMGRVLSKPYDSGIPGGSGFDENDPDPVTLAAQATEVRERFSRMANLITTRSDVFEILVTVQAGYGFDENEDGRLNYRSDREFISTSEQHARMIYER